MVRPPPRITSPLPRVVLAALCWWPPAGGLAGAVFGYSATTAWGGAAAPLPAVLLLAGAGASVAVLLVLLLLALPPSALRAVQRRLREPAPARAPLGTSLATQGTAERPDRSSGPATP